MERIPKLKTHSQRLGRIQRGETNVSCEGFEQSSHICTVAGACFDRVNDSELMNAYRLHDVGNEKFTYFRIQSYKAVRHVAHVFPPSASLTRIAPPSLSDRWH